MALMTFLQHLFQILWSELEPMRRAAVTPASLDSSNIVIVPEVPKDWKFEDSRRIFQA